MADIQLIKVNTESAISNCDELLNELNRLESLKHSLNYIVNTDIPNIWTSDTSDVASISTNLKSNISFLDDFIRFSKGFSMTLQDYAVALKAIGNEGDGTVTGTADTGTPDETGSPNLNEDADGEAGGEKMVNGPLGSGTSFRDAALEATGKNETTQTSDIDAMTSASPSTSQTDSSLGQTTSAENTDTKFPQSNKEIYDTLMDSYEDSFVKHNNMFTGDNASADEGTGPKLVDEGVGPGFTYKVYKE